LWGVVCMAGYGVMDMMDAMDGWMG
jgi:hypothetical protein